MTRPADYHMHTPLCRHAKGEPTEYASRALAVGLDEIGFSDHAPFPQDDFDDWRMKLSELPLYLEGIRKAQRDHPGLVIRCAMEVDYLPEAEDWARELATRHPWDYVIGSVHYVADHWDFDNPQKLSEWKRRDPWEVWQVYWDRLTRAAESGLFDIIGHADLCKKFCYYPKQDCTPLFRRFLEAAARKSVCIELNTAGLRKDCKEIYPSRSILTLAAELGVPITFGSDAHAPEEVGQDLDAAVQLAREAGYRDYCRFERRQRRLLPLP
jgi:histidinol-phosphatase (PHP family)